MSDDLQTIRLAVEVKVAKTADPEGLRLSLRSALDLITDDDEYQPLNGDPSFEVKLDDTPQDTDGPFALFVGEQGNISDDASKSFETWVAALAGAQGYENSGYFAEIQDAHGTCVYSTEH